MNITSIRTNYTAFSAQVNVQSRDVPAEDDKQNTTHKHRPHCREVDEAKGNDRARLDTHGPSRKSHKARGKKHKHGHHVHRRHHHCKGVDGKKDTDRTEMDTHGKLRKSHKAHGKKHKHDHHVHNHHQHDGPKDIDKTSVGAHGMLRKLQSGSFKGVADLRLRIAHHDRIVALETEATKLAAGESVKELADSINNLFEQILASEDLTEDQKAILAQLQDGFNEVLNNLGDAFQNAEGLTANTLLDGLQDAFDSLLADFSDQLITSGDVPGQVADIVAPVISDDSVVTEPVIPDAITELPVDQAPEGDDQNPLLALVEGLKTAFAEGMKSIAEALNSMVVQQPQTAMASYSYSYVKFTAVYEQFSMPDVAQAEMIDMTPPAVSNDVVVPDPVAADVTPPVISDDVVETDPVTADAITELPVDQAPVGNDQNPLLGFLENLKTAFKEGMQAITQALVPEALLPEVTAPTGNSYSYAKFTATYEQLSVQSTVSESQGDPPPVVNVA